MNTPDELIDNILGTYTQMMTPKKPPAVAKVFNAEAYEKFATTELEQVSRLDKLITDYLDYLGADVSQLTLDQAQTLATLRNVSKSYK